MDLLELRPWIVYLHVAGAFLFVLAHGASAIAAFAIRATREPERIRALLDVSGGSLGLAYLGLLVVLVSGIVAAAQVDQFSRAWPWVSLVTVIVLVVAMSAVGSTYYNRVRAAVGIRSYRTPKDAPDPEPAPPEELDRLLRSRAPEVLAAVGGLGLLLLLWLMKFQPF